ncbi:N-Acetyl-D-glucosamine ABC transport system, sugar-binding protein [Marinilactibacillus psychrotolerans 42ea]|uniref:N-Acetyl-D-glucosamine ABC transport system, sugar-binding protein n=1 Tax=Marinilactibacillus psychrotolerans 42ea TaxID=1255609 RepID=A0A1R4ISQ8_9LACT|nr:sugar ABC transporter substrate-binding protein [Marinilactibacillus psychrotolerans]SJN22699.1 N-Acetyl-D-glucosamine ABC transport system, sugar-binding protein [Marinilactibacillus psychrotolerans 42ea]
MVKINKLLLGTTSLLSLSLLAACGNGDEESASEESSDNLSVWMMGDGNETVQPIFDAYTEETGIEVDLQSIPWSAAHDRLLTAVASGEGPDVVQMGSTYMAEFTDAGALLDISDYIESSDALSPENFFEGNVATTMFDDNYYGVPWYTETRALYYRTDLLEEVGYPEGPSNWEELYDAAVKLSERGDNMYGFDINLKEQTFGPMFAKQNGSEIINDAGEPVLNEPEFVEAIEYLHSFVEAGATTNQDLGIELSQSFGGEGIVPMFISGPWSISMIEDQTTDIEGKWDIRTLPEGPVSNVSNTGGANLAVWSSSDHPDEAMDLIEHMVSVDSLMTYYDTTSSLPALVESWEEEPFQDEKIAVFGEQLENSEHMPLIEGWDRMSQAYLSSFEQIMVGGADIQETLDNLNEEVKTIIE